MATTFGLKSTEIPTYRMFRNLKNGDTFCFKADADHGRLPVLMLRLKNDYMDGYLQLGGGCSCCYVSVDEVGNVELKDELVTLCQVGPVEFRLELDGNSVTPQDCTFLTGV